MELTTVVTYNCVAKNSVNHSVDNNSTFLFTLICAAVKND